MRCGAVRCGQDCLHQRNLNVGVSSVLKPERQQPEDILVRKSNLPGKAKRRARRAASCRHDRTARLRAPAPTTAPRHQRWLAVAKRNPPLGWYPTRHAARCSMASDAGHSSHRLTCSEWRSAIERKKPCTAGTMYTCRNDSGQDGRTKPTRVVLCDARPLTCVLLRHIKAHTRTRARTRTRTHAQARTRTRKHARRCRARTQMSRMHAHARTRTHAKARVHARRCRKARAPLAARAFPTDSATPPSRSSAPTSATPCT